MINKINIYVLIGLWLALIPVVFYSSQGLKGFVIIGLIYSYPLSLINIFALKLVSSKAQALLLLCIILYVTWMVYRYLQFVVYSPDPQGAIPLYLSPIIFTIVLIPMCLLAWFINKRTLDSVESLN